MAPTLLAIIVAMGLVMALTLASSASGQGRAASSPATSPSGGAGATPRVLIVLSSHDRLGDTGKPTGFYLSEATHPHKVFKARGYQVDFVSPKGGKAPIDGLDLSDATNKAFMENKAYVRQIEETLAPGQVNPDRYEAIFFAGGHGTMWDFPDDEALMEMTRRIYERGGVVGAVCHGPAALVNVKLVGGRRLVEGKTVSCFTNEEEAAVKLEKVVPFALESRLIEAGAKVEKAGLFQAKVVVSERLVTGQNPASATGVAEAMAKLIEAGRR